MNATNTPVSIESIIQAIAALNWSEQQKLREILDDQLFESEENWENSPEIKAEIAEAKKAYRQGEYQTLSELIAQESKD